MMLEALFFLMKIVQLSSHAETLRLWPHRTSTHNVQLGQQPSQVGPKVPTGMNPTPTHECVSKMSINLHLSLSADNP